MRVITGSARGTRLVTPEGVHTRPTIERVKEALFSSIQFEVAGRNVLDLFAGSGQLGIEAMSRGALFCDFVDNDPAAIKTIEENIRRCSFEDCTRVFNRSYASHLTHTDKMYDLVFLDPPHHRGLVVRAMRTLADKCLAHNAIVVCETAADEVLLDTIGGMTREREKLYTRTRVTVFRFSSGQ